MDVDVLLELFSSLSGATENLQWEEELFFKVRGKIFAMVGLGSVPQRLTFKCKPETFAELAEREGIVPAPYVGRYKWVQLERLDALPDIELKSLVRESYDMVAAKTKSLASKGRKRKGSRKGSQP